MFSVPMPPTPSPGARMPSLMNVLPVPTLIDPLPATTPLFVNPPVF